MTKQRSKRKKSRTCARRVIDDSPQAVKERLERFVERTRGWGRQAAEMLLPDGIVVLAGNRQKTRGQ